MLWPFEYVRPGDPDEMSRILSEKPDAAIMAGGTNLIIDMELGKLRPDLVVDVKQVSGTDEMSWKKDSTSFVGSSVPMNMVLEDKAMQHGCVHDSGIMLATYQVRNRATIAGNIVNASPAADIAPPMLVLGTTVVIKKQGSERRVPLQDFFTGVGTTVLETEEWVFGLEVESHSPSTKSCFFKKQRIKGHDLAIVNMAGLIDPEKKHMRVSVGACAVTPLLFNLDEVYANASNADDLEAALLKIITKGCTPISDVRASAEYRQDMLAYFASLLISKIYS